MQTKYLLTFAALAILVGAIVSMTTSGVFAAQTNTNNTTTSASSSSGDSAFVKEALTDDDEKGGAEDSGTDDTAGEAEDNEDCIEDDSAADDGTGAATATSATQSADDDDEEEGAEDEDEAGDEDVNDEEDEDAPGEDANEADTENTASSTTANATGVNSEEDDDEEEDDHDAAFEPCLFTSEIDNPYMPLSKYVGKSLTFEGTSTEDGSSVNIREVWSVRSTTVDIADVETLPIVVQEYEDDELVSEAIQYYAQGIDGSVYYFGEEVADYENGKAVENDDESWSVGDDTAVPGIIMPAKPAKGLAFAYSPVNVPGMAHELHEVASTTGSLRVEQGLYNNVLEISDHDFNEGKTSQEFYASGVGLIKEVDEDEEMELVSIS
jgi:hypothetical protein